MTDCNDLESDVKKQIRAVLQTRKEARTVDQLRHDFRTFEGRDIPYRQLGYNSLTDFLWSIPDVVECSQNRDGVMCLRVVSDTSTQHIANMVAAQKSNRNRGKSASKYRQFSHFSRSYRPNIPPRLQAMRVNDAALRFPPVQPVTRQTGLLPFLIIDRMRKLATCYPHGLRLESLHSAYQRRFGSGLCHADYGYDTLEEFAVALEQRGTIRLERTGSTVFLFGTDVATPFPERNSNSAFRSTTPPASSEPTNKAHFVTHQEVELQPQALSPPLPVPLSASPEEAAGDQTGMVSEAMKEEFRKVLRQHPNGLDLSEFLGEYRRIHQKELDIMHLGYISVSDMVAVLTDVFTVVTMKHLSADWKLYDATNPGVSKISGDDKATSPVRTPVSVLISEHVKHNVQKVLQGFPEGVPLEEFEMVYQMNCAEKLSWSSLGFVDLSTFLFALDNNIPVRVFNKEGRSWVKLQDGVEDSTATERKANAVQHMSKVCNPGKIPSDAAPKTARYEHQQFTKEHNLAQYICVYVSQVDSPGQFWIQIRGRNTNLALEKLMDDLEKMYFGPRSEAYVIPEDYYMIGCPCIALFPRDNNWHRGLVLGIPMADRAEVLYVDYGTSHTVLKSQLRLITKEFLTRLPAQAIKTKLALLRPPGTKWSDRAKERLLQLVDNKPLMAFVINAMSETDRSVILCDVSDENDLYIHNVLLEEELAVLDEDAASSQDEEIPEVERTVHNNSSPEPCFKPLSDSGMGFAPSQLMQLLGAAFPGGCLPGSVPNYAMNNSAVFNLLLMHYLTLNSVQLNALMGLHNSMVPHMAASLAAGGDGMEARGLHGRGNPLAVMSVPNDTRSFVPFNMPAARSEKRQGVSQSFSSRMEPSTRHPTREQAPTLREVIENEDTLSLDDEEFIRQVCEEIDGGHRKYVKSVRLGPDIVFHIINYLGKPYVSAGDISALFSPNFDVRNMLHIRDQVVPSFLLKREDDDALFNQLERYGVKGIKKSSGGKDYIWLYELERVNEIVSIFRHLPDTLSEIIQDELNQFAEGTHWRAESPPTTAGIDLGMKKAKNWIEQLTLEELTQKLHVLKCERQRILEKIMKDIDDIGAVSYVDRLKEIETQARQMTSRMKELQGILHKINT